MSQYQALSKKHHAGFGYTAEVPFEFAKQWPFIPINSAELNRFLNLFPICFQKRGESYQLGLPTGLGQQNALIHPQNGRFLLPYVPSVLRRYPYHLLKNETGQDILCVLSGVSEFAKQSDPTATNVILTPEGELTEKGKGLLNFLTQMNQTFQKDAEKIQAIVAYDLLKPLPIQVKAADSEEPQLARNDLFIIDEIKLNQLPAEDLKTLIDRGALPMIYGHLFSMQKINQLNELIEAHIKLNQQADPIENLDSFFGEDDEDTLKF